MKTLIAKFFGWIVPLAIFISPILFHWSMLWMLLTWLPALFFMILVVNIMGKGKELDKILAKNKDDFKY